MGSRSSPSTVSIKREAMPCPRASLATTSDPSSREPSECFLTYGADDTVPHGGDEEVRPIDAQRVQPLTVHERPDCWLIQFRCMAKADSVLVHRKISCGCDWIASSGEMMKGACFRRMPQPAGFYFRPVADRQPAYTGTQGKSAKLFPIRRCRRHGRSRRSPSGS